MAVDCQRIEKKVKKSLPQRDVQDRDYPHCFGSVRQIKGPNKSVPTTLERICLVSMDQAW